ncbi:hypothetical protein CQZ94_18800 [Bacillus sp. MYb209]|nr:hypothetical protein CQZ94_18800 [Bacillus sp. MYb209]
MSGFFGKSIYFKNRGYILSYGRYIRKIADIISFITNIVIKTSTSRTFAPYKGIYIIKGGGSK